jgi:hypothetical protein
MAKQAVQPLPHSWCIEDWPSYVAPGNASRGRHLVRMHQNELVACGALTRIGRRLTVLGAGYAVFLTRGMSRVDGFEIAPNRKASASS